MTPCGSAAASTSRGTGSRGIPMGGSGVAAVLELPAVSKHYGPVVAADGIDLRIAADTHCCPPGPSGGGEEATVRVIGRPDTGTNGAMGFGRAPFPALP